MTSAIRMSLLSISSLRRLAARTSALGGVALALGVPVSAAQADALQAKIVAAARATPTARYAFRRTLVLDRSGAERKTYVEHLIHAAHRPIAGRWSASTRARPAPRTSHRRARPSAGRRRLTRKSRSGSAVRQRGPR